MPCGLAQQPPPLACPKNSSSRSPPQIGKPPLPGEAVGLCKALVLSPRVVCSDKARTAASLENAFS